MSARCEDGVEEPQVRCLVIHGQHGHGDVHHCPRAEVCPVASLAPEAFPVASLAQGAFPVAPERNASIWPGSARTLIGFSTYPSKPANDARALSSAIARAVTATTGTSGPRL